MIKYLVHFLILICFITLSYGQTVNLETFPVQPRFAEEFETDIYDRPYNGLQNVGVGTKVYLKGYSDVAVGAAFFTIVSKPSGSNTALSAVEAPDDFSRIVYFLPDVVGKYEIEFAFGTEFTSIIINAGTYLGFESEAPTCNDCHSDKVTGWQGTGHADMFVRAMNGTLSSHYNENCVHCHTTGYDENADNNGFDDRDFIFPDSLYDGLFDELFTSTPEAMKLANIQCESCHGPGSEHKGDLSDSKMLSDISSDNCAICHNEGPRHVYPEQWDISGHADPVARSQWRSSCSKCHTGAGFIQFAKDQTVTAQPTIPITCAVCHDPHDPTNDHQLRLAGSVELGDGTVIDNGGTGILCMNCHKGRRDGVDYATTYLDHLSSHYGPHHGPQTDVYFGENTPLGDDLPKTNHPSVLEKACVSCHMDGAKSDEDGNVLLVGGHSFQMKDPDGNDHIEVCQSCHPDYEGSFDDISFSVNGTADLDGDGSEEGFTTEIHGLLDNLAMLIPPLGDTSLDVIDSTWTPEQAIGLYNYKTIEEDRSNGLHNPAWSVALLNKTIALIDSTNPVLSDYFYLGTNEVNCAPCHEDGSAGTQLVSWKETGHATSQTADNVSFLRYSCLACHTTGWNPDLDNFGADEFVEEDTTATFGWVVTDEAKFAAKTNIQCETCHGPLGQENGTRVGGHSSVASVDLEADLCGACHQGSHHPTFTEWQESKHAFAKFTTIPGRFEWIASNPGCAGCHTAEGFLQFIEQEELEPHVNAPGPEGNDLTCAACHNPHGNENTANLRLPADEICVKCHQPEFNPDAPEPDGSDLHHTTAFMFEGKGGHEYIGYEYPSSLHTNTTVIPEKCVTCHVFQTPFLDEPEEIPAFTGHTFEPQLGACEGCHAGIQDFDYKGVQTEIIELQEQLKAKLDMASSNDSTSTNFYRAKWNYDFVHADGSNGIHNTKYARALLLSALDNFNPTVTDIDELDGLPTTYNLSQNYPNPFNPSTQIRFSLPEAAHVKITVFDALGKEVDVLVDEEMNAGNYNISWNASINASGIYFYRMESADFVSVKKMILVK